MKELQLKYGCNPNQKPSRIYMEEGQDLPIKGSNFFQTCFSCRSCSRTSAYRDTGKDLLGR